MKLVMSCLPITKVRTGTNHCSVPPVSSYPTVARKVVEQGINRGQQIQRMAICNSLGLLNFILMSDSDDSFGLYDSIDKDDVRTMAVTCVDTKLMDASTC